MEYDISASRIKRHAKCPEQYRLRYLEDKEPTKHRKGYMELGSLVHEAIENVLNRNPDENSQSRLTGMLKQEFYGLEESDEYDLDLISDKQRSDGLDCLETAAKFIAQQQKEGVEIREIEKFVKFNMNAVDKDALGFIDVVTGTGIWDWKTGRIRDDTERDEVIQGSVYMAGYFNEYGEMPDHITFVYLKEEKVREVAPTEENWNQMLKHARKLVNAARKDEYPPDPEEGKCYFCDWEMWCSASAVSPGQIQAKLDDGQPELWDAI